MYKNTKIQNKNIQKKLKNTKNQKYKKYISNTQQT